jgi:hypothetical protein
MVTMKMLFTNKGISLVVLLIAMTLISVLGASFVSLMSAKQKSFLHQIDSYRALNIANAGTEFAMRVVSDNINASENHIAQCPSWTTHDFAKGQFIFCYVGDNSNPDFNTISVEGRYDGGDPTHTIVTGIRRIRITNFMSYASADKISRIPHNPPRAFNNYVIIPIVKSSGVNETIDRVDLLVSFSGTKHLQHIYFTDDINDLNKVNFFDFLGSSFPECATPSPPPCKDNSLGIEMASGNLTSFLGNISYAISDGMARWCVIAFQGNDLSGQYIVRFYSAGSLIGSLVFTLN